MNGNKCRRVVFIPKGQNRRLSIQYLPLADHLDFVAASVLLVVLFLLVAVHTQTNTIHFLALVEFAVVFGCLFLLFVCWRVRFLHCDAPRVVQDVVDVVVDWTAGTKIQDDPSKFPIPFGNEIFFVFFGERRARRSSFFFVVLLNMTFTPVEGVMAFSAMSAGTAYGLRLIDEQARTVTKQCQTWYQRWSKYAYYINQSNPLLFQAVLEWLHGHEHLLQDAKEHCSERMTAFLPNSQVSFLLLPFNQRCRFDTSVGEIYITVLSVHSVEKSSVSNLVFRIETERRSWLFGREKLRNRAVLDAFMVFELDARFQPPDECFEQIKQSLDARYRFRIPKRIFAVLEEQHKTSTSGQAYPKAKLDRFCVVE